MRQPIFQQHALVKGLLMDELKPPKPQVEFDEFTKLDLRVARVLECREHPNADKLLVFKVDLGHEQRQICATLKGHYQPEELVGKLVVVVANLEPRSMRGEASQGLLLSAAEGPMRTRLVILSPAGDLPPGSVVG
jgi:methionine--tRNA ligase beta chain